MNFEMIIRKCQEAKRIEDALDFQNEYRRNVLNCLIDGNLENIQKDCDILEEKLRNCEKVIKSLTI